MKLKPDDLQWQTLTIPIKLDRALLQVIKPGVAFLTALGAVLVIDDEPISEDSLEPVVVAVATLWDAAMSWDDGQ